MSFPLKGIKVLEMEGLAPTVFAGQILADFGADVTIISRMEQQTVIGNSDPMQTTLNRGKKSITLDLKNPNDLQVLGKMMATHDVFIDSMRPGAMEKMGYGPKVCLNINPKLVYARISSYGQESKLSSQAGHDINFISYSGVLSMTASTGNISSEQAPAIPANIVGDFGAGSTLGVVGILAAVIESQRTGKGQIVDLGMAQASIYLSSFIVNSKLIGQWNNVRGQNPLDGGAHFYNVYQCSDGKFMSVGCIEPKFYSIWVQLLRKAQVDNKLCDILADNEFSIDMWAELKIALTSVFQQKTREEWTEIFKDTDACCGPVYDSSELKIVGNLNLGSPNRPLVICRDVNNKDAFEISPQPILSNMAVFRGPSQIPLRGQNNDLKPKL